MKNMHTRMKTYTGAHIETNTHMSVYTQRCMYTHTHTPKTESSSTNLVSFRKSYLN